ncbi:hypothetical protein GQ54DRAFT_253675 [Martensiomyces pterosporus]|nr:hypothetical protein GQ54DRAFT_253675 [Martensiomyces pterosporus]
MDKDKFRELLQTFEQLSVKPEAEPELESDTQTTATVTPEPREEHASAAAASDEPAAADLKRLLALVNGSSTSFPELEATHPPLDSDQFRPSELLKSTAAHEYGGDAEMQLQRQLHTASRFRFTAGFAARLWLSVQRISGDRLTPRNTQAALAGLEADLISLCSASLLEASQLEKRALEQQKAQNDSNSNSNSNSNSSDPEAQRGDGDNLAQSNKAAEAALGARIGEFASAWPAVSTDPWVLDTVAHGVRFDFAAEPELPDVPEPDYTPEERAAIEKVVRWDLGDRVIEEVVYHPDLFVSHMYTLRIAGKHKALMECHEICLLHESCSELITQTKSVCRHLSDLGFLLNMPTSDLVPQQNQRFLGFVFNTADCTIQLPKDQIKKVRRAAHTARSSSITAKQLASLIGKIRSIVPAVGPELWRIQEIERSLESSVTAPESWDEKVQLSPAALAEIDWLCDNILSHREMAFESAASLLD